MKMIIATGGTGGHLFPALWVAHQLRKQKHEILLVGSFSMAQEQIRKKQFEFIDLKAKGMRFKGLKEGSVSLWLMLVAFLKAIKILLTYKPKVVLGFGGYGAFPVVLAAKLLRCPTIIHEQNVVPGKANAFLGKIVDKIAVSFEETKEFFNGQKVIVTGCPCHPVSSMDALGEALAYFGFKDKKFTLLVFGGSQGSAKINDVFIRVVKPLSHIKDFQVIHVTGIDHFDIINEKYASLGVPFSTYKFLERMDYAYRLADMVISRAGAVTIAEIIQARVPSVLIPYPYAYAGHQKLNAEILSNKSLATLIEEPNLNKASLENAILHNFDKKQSMKNLDELFADISYTDSSKRLAEETIRLASDHFEKEAKF